MSTEPTPPWTTGRIPTVDNYLESEVFVAGAISTLPPFDQYHPAWCLPVARQALDALSQWEPSDAAFEQEWATEDADR